MRMKKTPFLPQERRLQRARRAYSRMQLGLLLFSCQPMVEQRKGIITEILLQFQSVHLAFHPPFILFCYGR